MTLKPLAMILTCLGLSGPSCSDGRPTRNDTRTICSAALVEICRETYPGVFKLDRIESCQADGRSPEENEVPMSYCQTCQEKQAAAIAAMNDLWIEGERCSTNEDCSVVYVKPAAEFGCGGAFTQAFDSARYNQLAEDWNSCTLTEAVRCQESQNLVPPRCDKGRCTLSAK